MTGHKLTVRRAFYKTVPIMAGYIVLGMGFGILLRNAGYGVLWALSMSLFIYAGSMQYVGVGLLTGGASVITTAITTIMVNCRHLSIFAIMISWRNLFIRFPALQGIHWLLPYRAKELSEGSRIQSSAMER